MNSLVLLLLGGMAPAFAGVALLVGEPFGKFGAFNPTGHAAVYLSRVCAETPTKLRLCHPGEAGVVISRYNRVANRDWIAVPLLPYLYAVEHAGEVPRLADRATASALREAYRSSRLEGLDGDWNQLAGAAYDRNIYGFALETTIEDDERLIQELNSRPNRRRFNILYRNCADFARAIVNFYYPRALRRSIIADAGITTPKHAAKALVSYSRRRELPLTRFVIPQVDGTPRSRRLRGVSESLVRSKKYVVPLAVLQPWVAGTAAVAYLTSGRFSPRPSQVCEPSMLPACASGELLAAATDAPSSDVPPAHPEATQTAERAATATAMAP